MKSKVLLKPEILKSNERKSAGALLIFTLIYDTAGVSSPPVSPDNPPLQTLGYIPGASFVAEFNLKHLSSLPVSNDGTIRFSESS